MRATTLLATATLLVSSLAQASDDCRMLTWLDLSAEDVSIIASVRPQVVPPTVLVSMPDPYGRMDPEQLSQIQSVQPEGKKKYVCITSPRKVN